MNDLSALIERVESKAGSDRELDFVICAAVSGRSIGAAKVTSSLDAVLSLIEAKLLGWGLDISLVPGNDPPCMAHLWPPERPNPILADGNSMARAALAAALRAIQESRNDR